MSLNSFAFTGGANVAVGPTPLAVQVAGTTLVVANIGDNTVYGSVGGSASTTLNPTTYIAGGSNTSTGVGGWAVPPKQSAVIDTSGQTWVWLATLSGAGSVNVANGTVSGGTTVTPGGSTTQLQFNDVGVFGGTATVTWDKTNSRMTFPSPSNAPSIIFSAGNTNTGIGGNAGNFLSFFNNGTENIRVDQGVNYINNHVQIGNGADLINLGRVNYNSAALSLSNGLNSNISITTSYGRITGPTGGFSLGGFSSGRDGGQLDIFNTTTQAMTIVNEDASSTAGNRITTLTGGNIVLAASVSSAHFVYDNGNARWILLSARDSSGPK